MFQSMTKFSYEIIISIITQMIRLKSVLYRSRVLLWMVFTSIFFLTSCASFIPTSGPSTRNVTQVNESMKENTLILDLDDQVIDHLSKVQQKKLFSELFKTAASSEFIGIGDILEIVIWEAPPAVLFSGPVNQTGSGSAHVTVLPEQIVDQQGEVIVPFIGSLSVVNTTPRQISETIVSKLKSRANQPQVLVRIINNNSKLVTVIRDGHTTQLPLTSKRERILDALAAVKGTTHPMGKTSVQLTRANQHSSLPLMHIINNPWENILLQSGDVLSLLYEPSHFVVLGATGKNEEIGFEAEGITLAQALGRIGGLNDHRADAQGIFIFRLEKNESVRDLLDPENKLAHAKQIPTIYKVNLKDHSAFFYAQNFMIQDRDILYVSNAPATELNKFIRTVFSWTSPAIYAANAVNSFN